MNDEELDYSTATELQKDIENLGRGVNGRPTQSSIMKRLLKKIEIIEQKLKNIKYTNISDIFTQSLEIAQKFGFKVKLDEELDCPGTAKVDNNEWTIIYRNDATPYTILHEIGHCLYGYGCCREHDEYIAHGIAIGLAKLHEIELKIDIYKVIETYAGRSSHESCGAIGITENVENKEVITKSLGDILNLFPTEAVNKDISHDLKIMLKDLYKCGYEDHTDGVEMAK